MPKFVFLLHDDSGAEPAVMTEMLESDIAADAFGRSLLAERSASIAVEIHSGGARIRTIKNLGQGQTASTPVHPASA